MRRSRTSRAPSRAPISSSRRTAGRNARRPCRPGSRSWAPEGVGLQRFSCDNPRRGRVRRVDHDGRRDPRTLGFVPTGRAQAPLLSGAKPGKRSTRRHEIVALRLRERQELVGQLRADDVHPGVVGSGGALSVAEPSGQRCARAHCERSSREALVVGPRRNRRARQRTRLDRRCVLGAARSPWRRSRHRDARCAHRRRRGRRWSATTPERPRKKSGNGERRCQQIHRRSSRVEGRARKATWSSALTRAARASGPDAFR